MPSFRDHVPAPSDPRIAALRGLGWREYGRVARTDSFAGPMIEGWSRLYPAEFRGITADGTLRTGLFPRSAVPVEQAAPTATMVAAARAMLAGMPPRVTDRMRHPVDAVEWQSWSNPEFVQHDTGVRLEELPVSGREAILALVRASLSPAGYELVRNLMRINGFLGDVVGLPALMNEFSYHFALYGTPSATAPWGWQLFGHHVALNVLVDDRRMVATPVFLAAEPSSVDAGPHAGTTVFDRRIALARSLITSLPPDLQERAVLYPKLVDPAMPPGRIHPGDERHLAGCFQDNRIIPYEGVGVAAMGDAARDRLVQLVEECIGYLPDGPRARRMDEVSRHLSDTWFCWMGGTDSGDPFYLRVQSPVIIVEIDHHCGVFLTNTEPAAFHLHTVVRTPNGNDYGRSLVQQSAAGGPVR